MLQKSTESSEAYRFDVNKTNIKKGEKSLQHAATVHNETMCPEAEDPVTSPSPVHLVLLSHMKVNQSINQSVFTATCQIKRYMYEGQHNLTKHSTAIVLINKSQLPPVRR